MKRKIQAAALTGTLLLSGCFLKVDIVGQGVVSDADNDIVCSEDCTRRSIGSFKQVVLNAEAAPGYQFYGFIEDYKDQFETHIEVAPNPLYALYGYAPFYMGDEEPTKWTSVTTRVTAIFLPENSVQQVQQTHGSLCVLNLDQSLECWGKAQKAAMAVTGVVTGIVAEAGEAVDSNQWCALTDTTLACWNETTGNNWLIPANISTPTSAALVSDVACVVYQGDGVPMLTCLHEDGSVVANTPEITSPERVLVNEAGQFCAESAAGSQCWSAADAG